LNLCQIVGDTTLQAAESFKDMLPPDLMDKPLNFATQAGELIATIESTGESVGEIVASRLDNFSDKQQGLIKKLAQAHNAKNKAQKSFGDAGKQKVEPKKGTPEWNKEYPNGKYNGDNYHKPGGSSKKSPCPKNGQAALDRSIPVEGSRQRVTTEDGKIVILKYEEDGIYHGYLVEDFHSIENKNVQKILVSNGLVKDMKSGKVIK